MATGGRGSVIKLTAEFRDGANNLVDPDNPTVSIFQPDTTLVVDSATPTRESLGRYYYNYTIPLTAPLGTWTHTWEGTINGLPIGGSSTFTVTEAGTIGFGANIISRLRSKLGEAGEEKIIVVIDELQTSCTKSTVNTEFRRVTHVVGVWLAYDTQHTGTNYYTGGGYDPISGQIQLGTELPDDNTDVLINYCYQVGIDDDTLEDILRECRNWVIGKTHEEFEYGNTTTVYTSNLESLAFAWAVLQAILVINGANATQMGYNFRLEEFEIQTKLWGEGMIAEALFGQYVNLVKEWLSVTGIYIFFKRVGIPRSQAKYKIDTFVGNNSSEW